MSLADAAWAIREALRVCDAARDLVAAGAVGDVLDDTLRQAQELLDIADEELSGVDRQQYAALFTAAPALRAKLEALRNELRSSRR
jgi:hypothetical protein